MPIDARHLLWGDPKVCRREHRDSWFVYVRKANYSAFNGYHKTPSDYSEVRCPVCGRVWRTKAAYVDTLPGY